MISPVVVRANMTIRMSQAICAIVNRRTRSNRISHILWTDPERTLKAAYDSPDRATYNSTNRTCRIASNVCAMSDSVGYSLGIGGGRRNEHHSRNGCESDPVLHSRDLILLVRG